MARVGDVIEIPLPNEMKAYAQYVFKDRWGPLIQVFDAFFSERPGLDVILQSGHLFPPVITSLTAALSTGLWEKIGTKKVENFTHPGFISTLYDQKMGKASIWFYWNGEKSIRLGNELPQPYKSKEYLAVWHPQDVVDRIMTREIPFPYKDLIAHNQYSPK